MQKEFYTVQEAARLIGRPESDIRTAIEAGTLKAEMSHNIGDYLVRSEDLVRFQRGGAAAPEKFKVLIVDDEVNFSNILKLELERDRRFTVRYSSWGKDGIRSAQEFEPDLCLIDFMLPDTTGYEVLRAIRELQNTRATKVVVYSAHTREAIQQQPDLEDKLRKLGADDFISKSTGLRALLIKVYTLLGLQSGTKVMRRPGMPL